MGNFNDEYQKLRKKRLGEQNGGIERSSVPYQRLTNTSSDRDIAPVVRENERRIDNMLYSSRGYSSPSGAGLGTLTSGSSSGSTSGSSSEDDSLYKDIPSSRKEKEKYLEELYEESGFKVQSKHGSSTVYDFSTSFISDMSDKELDEAIKNILNAKNNGSDISDIAPITSNQYDYANEKAPSDVKAVEKDGERTWFKASEGDIAQTILGSATDLLKNVGVGIVGIAEAAVDGLLTIAPYVAQGQYYQNGGGYNLHADQMFNQSIDIAKKENAKIVEKDLINEEKIADAIIADPVYNVTGVDAERDSVFAEKSDSLAQSGGQLLGTAALQAVGVPWYVTTGATALGSESEGALKQGATMEEAALSGMISAGAEILTEKLSGGIKFGGSTLDDAVTKELSTTISNKVVRYLAKSGVDIVGEGGEEVASSIISKFGQWITYQDEKTIEEMFASEEAFDEYLESFIGGGVLGGVSSGSNVVKSEINGMDAVTDLTKNEQKVVDKVYKDTVSEMEADGTKLTLKEKRDIRKGIFTQLEKGYIPTEKIEGVLGGEGYNRYQTEVRRQQELANELSELRNMKTSEMTDVQIERMNELKATQTDKELLNSLKFGVDDSIRQAIEADSKRLKDRGSYLAESYNEQVRRGQAFEADLSQYDETRRKIIQNAIDSGILNNTNRTHDFVDLVANISADKGVLFDFANNEKIKESGFAIEGKTVNGYVTKDGVTLNMDSAKSLNSVVGHEISHVLEGTELYAELSTAITEYAKSKGDYQARYDALKELYKGVKDADIDAELTADLVGDYLFTDEKFVNNLSVQNRNVFKKIWDEIEYLYNLAVAGSKEKRDLERVKKVFEKAYKESGNTKNTANDSGVKYSLNEFNDGRRFVSVETDQAQFDGLSTKEQTDLATKIIKERFQGKVIGIDNRAFVNGKTADEYTHPAKHLEADIYEAKMRASTELDNLMDAGFNFRNEADGKYGHSHSDAVGGFDYFDAIFKVGSEYYQGVINIKNINRGKLLKDITQIKNITQDVTSQYGETPSYAFLRDASMDNIPQKEGNVNTKFSISSDSDGRELSPAVKNRFGNSKVVDENGALKVVYHGTATGEFSIFDKSKGSVEGDFGSGFYFTDNDTDVSEHYEGGGPDFDNKVGRRADEIWGEEPDIEYEEAERRAREELYKGSHKFEVYLNIENPAIVGETQLLTQDKYLEEYDPEDYDSEDDYYGDIEQLVADDIDGIIWDIDRNIDVNNTDGIANVLYDAYYNDGIGIEELKKAINDLYLEDSNGNLVGNEVTRQIIESLGYDGIIDSTVSGKWRNMNIEPGTTHYIVFKPNQIKAITNESPTDNPDIHRSLSAEGSTPKRYGNYNVYGKDIGLAPVRGDISKVENTTEEAVAPVVAPVVDKTVDKTYPDDFAPTEHSALYESEVEGTRAEMDRLSEEASRLYGEGKVDEAQAIIERMQELNESTKGVRDKYNTLRAQEKADTEGYLNSLTDADAPAEMEAPYYEDGGIIDPFEDRNVQEVGNRKVKAFMDENPEVKPYFQEEANILLGELQSATKGEKMYIPTPDGHLDKDGSMVYGTDSYGIWMGTSRSATDDIVKLLDDANGKGRGYTYAEIEKGLKDIIADNEKNACVKRIEFVINDRLMNGYTTSGGVEVPANQEYRNLIKEKGVLAGREEAFGQLIKDADKTTEDIAPIAPIAEKYETIKPKPETTSGPSMKRADNPSNAPSGMEERRWVGTSTSSEAVDGIVTPDDIPDDVRYYQVKSNKSTLAAANARLAKDGYAKSREYFEGRMTERKLTVEDIALGERLIQEAAKAGDAKAVRDLIIDVSIIGTELGQRVQALSMIRRLTPEGQLKTLTRMVERGKAKGDKAFKDVEVTDDMTNRILQTYKTDGTFDQAELNAAVEDVKQQIADKMKVTIGDRINAWRYLAMLGNPKTHIRNIVSNVAMMGTREVKNAVARTIEDIAPIQTRTKTWKRATDEVKAFAKQTTTEMKSAIQGDTKYSEEGSLKSKRKMFGGIAPLNAVNKFNSNALEFEDYMFSRPAFKQTLQEYLTANGIETEADILNNPEIVSKARDYALEEAKRATFRQDSYLASKIHEVEKKNAIFGVAVGSVMPFKKTPINIAKTGLAYSPLGFARNIYDAVQVKKGNMDASEAVDHLAQTLTGTSLTVLGFALASMGVINGAGDDDKEGKYDYQLGKQSYSINLFGNSYSLSWLSPVAMPLFVGANAYEILVEQKEWDVNVVVDTLAQTLDPLSEMSFLSSLDDVLSSYDSGTEKFMAAGESMVQNYATQFIPTLSSQVAATFDDTKRSTAASRDSGFKFGEETYNKIAYKIPGLRNTLEPTTDIWGNEAKQDENVLVRGFNSFFNPANKREGIGTAVDEELKSLYGETDDSGVLPSIPQSYINYDGEKYNMSSEEYTEYKKLYGQTAYDLMEKLFATETYKNASSEDRADMVNRVYDYARDNAKKEYFAGIDLDFTNATKDGKEYYKENSIVGAIEADLPVDEYDFSTENPEKYNFFKDNDLYDSYKSADEDGKRAYNWAYENPGKYTMSKAISNDFLEFYGIKSEMSNIKGVDKDGDGKSDSGTRKSNIISWLNGLDMETGQRAILYRMVYDSKADKEKYNNVIVRYLNTREDITRDEKLAILAELGMRVDSEGYVWWD